MLAYSSMEERTNLNLKEGKGRVNMFSYDKCADVCVCMKERDKWREIKNLKACNKNNMLYSISCNNL